MKQKPVRRNTMDQIYNTSAVGGSPKKSLKSISGSPEITLRRSKIRNTSPCVQKKIDIVDFIPGQVQASPPKLRKLYRSEVHLEERKRSSKAVLNRKSLDKRGAQMIQEEMTSEQLQLSNEMGLNQRKLKQVKNDFLKKNLSIEKTLKKLKSERLEDKEKDFLISQKKLAMINKSKKIIDQLKKPGYVIFPNGRKRGSISIIKNHGKRVKLNKSSNQNRKSVALQNKVKFPKKKLKIQKIVPKRSKKFINGIVNTELKPKGEVPKKKVFRNRKQRSRPEEVKELNGLFCGSSDSLLTRIELKHSNSNYFSKNSENKNLPSLIQEPKKSGVGNLRKKYSNYISLKRNF